MRVVTGIPLDDWSKAGPAAAAAEAAGYDGLASAEIAHDPFTPLALAALATESIQLSTGIAVAFPRSPMVMANLAWDLQLHSRGRFVLGLGSQVKGHNERRFSTPWSPPVPRLREYIESLRAIWRCWELGEKLDYTGEHYRFSLMTPEFSPEPTGLAPVPVEIAAVGPDMLRLAGRVCDGVRLHGFCTRRYAEQVCLPRIEEGLARGGGRRDQFEISGGGFVATAPDRDSLRRAAEQLRYRVAFYGSTRSYRGVLSTHGLDDLGDKLHRMSVEGKWAEMPGEVSDEVLGLFAAIAPYDGIAAAIEERFGGLSDSVGIGFPADAPAAQVREVLADVRRIPTLFETFRTDWRD